MYALAAFLSGRILLQNAEFKYFEWIEDLRQTDAVGPDLLDFLRKKKYDVRNRSIQKTHVLHIDTVNQKENLP